MPPEFKPIEITFPDADPSRTTFVETFVWEPAMPQEARLGGLYLVGQIISPNPRRSNAEMLLKLANLIKDEYYRNSERSALNSFRFALGKANTFLNNQFKINLVVAAISEGVFMSSRLGEGIAVVLRSGSLSNLETRAGTSFSNVVEGKLERDDTIILATPQLHRVGLEHLRTLAAPKKLTEFLKKNGSEFKNLGCIILAARPANPPSVSLLTPVKTLGFQNLRLKSWFSRVITLGLVLALTIAALAYERNLSQRKIKASEILTSIGELETKTMELFKIGNFYEAERLLDEWRLRVAQLEELRVLNEEANKVKKNLEAVEPRIKRYETVLAREVLTFQNNTLGFAPAGITSSRDGLLLFDEKSLYNFNLRAKSGGFRVLPDNIQIKDVLTHPVLDDSFLILTTANVLEYREEGFSSLATTSAETSLIAFYNNNVYILSENAVWVLRQGEELLPWLKTKTAIGEAKDFVIDGFVYVLEGSGSETKIVKLLNGEKRGEFKTDTGSERLAAQVGFRHLYVLNPRDGTIVVIDKSSLAANRRLQHQSFKDARDIVVSEDEKTLYLLSGEKVFSVEL